MWPKTIPPSGRTAKPTAKMANVPNSAAVGSPGGKKCRARMLANQPYSRESYPWMTVPTAAAAATRCDLVPDVGGLGHQPSIAVVTNRVDTPTSGGNPSGGPHR